MHVFREGVTPNVVTDDNDGSELSGDEEYDVGNMDGGTAAIESIEVESTMTSGATVSAVATESIDKLEPTMDVPISSASLKLAHDPLCENNEASNGASTSHSFSDTGANERVEYLDIEFLEEDSTDDNATETTAVKTESFNLTALDVSLDDETETSDCKITAVYFMSDASEFGDSDADQL